MDIFAGIKGEKKNKLSAKERAELYADALETIGNFFLVTKWAPLRFWDYPRLLRLYAKIVDEIHNIANEALYNGGELTVYSRDEDGKITGMKYRK